MSDKNNVDLLKQFGISEASDAFKIEIPYKKLIDLLTQARTEEHRESNIRITRAVETNDRKWRDKIEALDLELAEIEDVAHGVEGELVTRIRKQLQELLK